MGDPFCNLLHLPYHMVRRKEEDCPNHELMEHKSKQQESLLLIINSHQKSSVCNELKAVGCSAYIYSLMPPVNLNTGCTAVTKVTWVSETQSSAQDAEVTKGPRTSAYFRREQKLPGPRWNTPGSSNDVKILKLGTITKKIYSFLQTLVDLYHLREAHFTSVNGSVQCQSTTSHKMVFALGMTWSNHPLWDVGPG